MASPERARERGEVVLDRIPGPTEDGGAGRPEESPVGRLLEEGGLLRAGRGTLGGAQVLHAGECAVFGDLRLVSQLHGGFLLIRSTEPELMVRETRDGSGDRSNRLTSFKK